MTERLQDSDSPSVQADTNSRSVSESRRPSRGERVSRAIFVGSATLLGVGLVFMLGVLFAVNQIWPFRPIERAVGLLEEAVEYGALAPENSVGQAPEQSSGEAFTVHRPDQFVPGYRALMGYRREHMNFAIWLFDENGDKIHERVLNYDVQDPDGPSGGSEAPHAFLFLSDGSVLVNTDKGDVLTRYDSCGEPIWTREGPYHHSFAAAPDGSVWTWLGERSAFSQYQYVVRFDPETGEELQRIDLARDIVERDEAARTLFALVPGHELVVESGWRTEKDLFHPNDVEVLMPEMADAFPDFEAGDLLMSFRNVDLVTVVDPDTYAIKWYSHGPWIQQHDPDFTDDGLISVYNNNRWRDKSSIVLIDPTTRDVTTHPVEPDYRFYTSYMGKHEYLDDGTLQVVVPYEGRALEFDPEGNLVLEINNLWSDEHQAFVADYAWLPLDFFDDPAAALSCELSEASTT